VAVVAGDVFYVYADHINTPRVIARSIDNLTVWSWHAADPFGARLQISDPSGLGEFTYNPRFPGQLYDQETGTHYNYYRDYDPRTGRYAQSDPLGLAGGINTYGYVGGNPVNLADPLGLINPGSAVGAGLGSLMLPGPGTIIGGIIGTGLGAWGIYDFTRPNAKVMPASSRVPRPPGMTRREERHFDRHCANSDDPCRSLKAAVAIAIGEAHVKMDKMDYNDRDKTYLPIFQLKKHLSIFQFDNTY